MATFGETGGGFDAHAMSPDYKQVSIFTLSGAALASKISVDVDGAGGGGNIKGVVYADSGGVPAALKAVSNEVAIANAQAHAYVDCSFPVAVSLTAGDYWLGFITPSGAISYYTRPLASGTTYDADTYADGPSDPFGTPDGTAAGQISAYVTYTVPTTDPSIFYVQA